MELQIILSSILLKSRVSDIENIRIALQVIALTLIVGTIVYNTLKFIRDTKEEKAKVREANQKSFELLVSHLTSNNTASQLSAAILLRKYFNDTNKKDEQDGLRKETINVISSMLRILPTCVLQKTLADGLGFATEL